MLTFWPRSFIHGSTADLCHDVMMTYQANYKMHSENFISSGKRPGCHSSTNVLTRSEHVTVLQTTYYWATKYKSSITCFQSTDGFPADFVHTFAVTAEILDRLQPACQLVASGPWVHPVSLFTNGKYNSHKSMYGPRGVTQAHVRLHSQCDNSSNFGAQKTNKRDWFGKKTRIQRSP